MGPKITTLGALNRSGYRSRSVRDEVRENLIDALKRGDKLFPGVIGYDETVIPRLVNGLLSRHDILLLGLRGQAKTRVLRSLVRFLDEWTPVVRGSSLNEDPAHPITNPIRSLIEEMGDDTPIDWLHRDERFQEKLATPDVTMADLIGDIDPIRASRERLDLSDERVMHFGLVPRTNRGMLCINELPDLQTRIQVGLLNILEERDIQIRGFPIRLKLDIIMLFTANPEDYTNRGNIITPLKDRIGSQIVTHYPRSIEDAMAITTQEANTARTVDVRIPVFFREIVEEIAMQARESEHVDQSSGVSARLPISATEILVSSVERRMLTTQDPSPCPRVSDLFALGPAIVGKVELVYEGEQEGASIVADRLVGKAIRSVFQRYFPPIHPEKRAPARETEPLYSKVQAWFSAGRSVEITDYDRLDAERKRLREIDGLEELARKYLRVDGAGEETAAMEFVLEGLHQHSLLSKEGLHGATTYGDMISRMMQDL
jgi:magnesium chelatase subunit I